MKQLLLLVFIIGSTCADAQESPRFEMDTLTHKYTHREIVRADSSLSDTLIYEETKAWAASATTNLNRLKDDKAAQKQIMEGFIGPKYNNPATLDQLYKNKSVVKLDNPNSKKIMLQGIYKHTSKLYSCLQTCYVNYDVIIQCRKGRARIEFTNLTFDMYNTSDMKPLPRSGLSLEALIETVKAENGQPCLQRILDCMTDINNHVQVMVDDYKKHLASLKTVSTSDGW